MVKKNNKWSKEQIQILEEKYSYEKWDVLEQLLHPFKKQKIIEKASSLKIKREVYFYSQEQIDFLKENYYKYPINELSKMLNKTKYSIMTKASDLGISNQKHWTIEEVEYLKKHYKTISNIQISKHINRKPECIGMKARELGLKKENFKYYNPNEFIENLKIFAKNLGRTPFAHEVYEQKWSPSDMSIQRYFGGYRKACILSGLEVNANIFGKSYPMYKSKKGDLCWSKSELVITNFFIDNNIIYKKEVPYSDYIEGSLKICDWVINENILVEYFGMMNKEYYKTKAEYKINICENNNVKLIGLTEKDIKNLKIIFEDYIN